MFAETVILPVPAVQKCEVGLTIPNYLGAKLEGNCLHLVVLTMRQQLTLLLDQEGHGLRDLRICSQFPLAHLWPNPTLIALSLHEYPRLPLCEIEVIGPMSMGEAEFALQLRLLTHRPGICLNLDWTWSSTFSGLDSFASLGFGITCDHEYRCLRTIGCLEPLRKQKTHAAKKKLN